MPSTTYLLPADIERHLAALSKLYAQEGNRPLQELIVNASVRVHEAWDAGTDFNEDWVGHALYLILPDGLFLRSVKRKEKLQDQIRDDLNKLHNVRGESIQNVFIEMEAPTGNVDWRAESGLLAVKRDVPKAAQKRIWTEGAYRVFLSHKSEVKKQAAELRDRLALFGISAFVAHEDIRPTRAWQLEIENALASMDAFVALLTDKFHDSNWTDQEVGYALARGVPMIGVKLGLDPYGFIGKFQALACDWKEAPVEISTLLMPHDRMVSAYVSAVAKCSSFDKGNELAALLPAIESLAESQVDELVAAYNESFELKGSWGFNGSRPGTYGQGLVHHLNRLSGSRNFVRAASGRIEPDPIPF